jgi:hypothetical protein
LLVCAGSYPQSNGLVERADTVVGLWLGRAYTEQIGGGRGGEPSSAVAVPLYFVLTLFLFCSTIVFMATQASDPSARLSGWLSRAGTPIGGIELRTKTATSEFDFVTVFGSQAFEKVRYRRQTATGGPARAEGHDGNCERSEMAPQAIGIAQNRLENGLRQTEAASQAIPAATPAAGPEQPRPPVQDPRRRADRCPDGTE